MFDKFDEYVEELESKVQQKIKEQKLFELDNYTKDETTKLAELTASLSILNGVSEVVTESFECINEYLEGNNV